MNQDNKFSCSDFPLQSPSRVTGQKRSCNSESDSHSSHTNECEHVFVTLIRATNVACGLRRVPAGFHVIVEVDERIIQTANKPVSIGKDAIEWDENILLPSDQLSSISFTIYASFELGPRLGNGDLLRQFKITVGEVFNHQKEQLQLINFTAQKDDILPSCSPFSIITERRICSMNESCPKLDLPEPCKMNVLEQLTDEGHRALLRYRQRQDPVDLDTAIQTFEHVQEICPIGHPNRSVVLFNLANARFIDCQANNRYLGLDVPIGLYQDALRLRSKNHPDHCATILELGLALLARFQRRGFMFDKEEATDLLTGVVDVSATESYIYQAGLFALQMAKVSRPMEAGDAGSSPADDVVQETRDSLWNLSYWNPRRPALLLCLGVLLSHRFKCNGVLADIHEAISMFEYAIHLTPHSHPDMLSLFGNLGSALLRRVNRLGDLADINRSISMLEKAVFLMPDGHSDKPDGLSNLGCSLSCRFERLGDPADLNRSISIREEAVCLTPDDHPDRPSWLNNLGNSLLRRFERLRDLRDLNRSISMFKEAVCLTPDGHPDKAAWLNNLGNSLFHRFEHLGSLADLNKSILIREEAVCLTPDGHPDKPGRLSNLGSSLLSRFMRLGDLVDLDKSISMREKAVYLTCDSHPSKPAWLNNLGNSLFRRFQRFGDLADLHRSISMFEEAVCLTTDGHSDKLGWLNNLGSLLLCRFEQLGDLVDLNKSISMLEEVVGLTPDGHSHKLIWSTNLGNSLCRRFQRLGDLADLNRSISMFEEAVHLKPGGHSDRLIWLKKLGTSLSFRFERLGDLADLNRSILMFEEGVSLTPDGHSTKPDQLNCLGNSLLSRFEHLGDLMDLNKSISMFEKGVSLTPNNHPAKPDRLNNLGSTSFRRFGRLGDLMDINKSISMFEEAICLTPDGHPAKPGRLNNLGNSLSCRFERLGDLPDLNKSILIKEEAVGLTPDGHPNKPGWLNNLGNSLTRRFERLGDLMDLNRAILMKEEGLSLTPDGHSDKPGFLSSLGTSLCLRSKRVGDLTDLNRSISTQEEAVCLSPDGHPDKPGRLGNLGDSLLSRFERLGNLADLTKSISIFEEAVCLTPDGHPAKPGRLNSLGDSLYRRFERLGKHTDIVKSISVREEAVSLTPDGHPDKPTLLVGLGRSFNIRFKHSHDSSDLSAAAFNFSVAGRASIGHAPTRFRGARAWILCAQLQGNTTALLDACACALNILPQLAWFGLPVTERHRLLVKAADVTRDSAAAALEAGHPELAVEWLEQGRSIVWTQFLQLRDPVDELRVDHPSLAHQFQLVSRELDHASSRNDSMNQRLTNNLITYAHSLEDEVQRHHELAMRRDKLLIEIRSLPGFDRFFLPKTIKQLAGAANSGPVIYLNASKYRCDALIVTTGQSGLGKVVPVSFPDVSYQDVVLMQCLLLKRKLPVISRDEILALMPSEVSLVSWQNCLDTFFKYCIEDNNREGALRIEGYSSEDRLRWILAFLWKRVLRPVLEALGFSTPLSVTEKMTHIYWCPTGPFSFLPIHAAGLYGATLDGENVSDFVISSYIPTLSALASSAQNVSNDLSSTIRLLLIPQPPEDGQTRLPCVAEEIDCIKSLSAKYGSITMQDSRGVVEDVMKKMTNADWVHFACHGVQDLGNPLNSGLCLANHRRLTLSDIIRLSRPQGGLAFLSACQTARGDEKLSEESVHLAAGMLLAGYSSVIATMWSIVDHDAPKVTRDVYEYLFQNRKVPDGTEAAEALHRAVRQLRESGVPFSSWVPFIHVGR